MIPYDELVSALSQWRERQGLGVSPTRTARRSGQVAAPPAPVFAAAPALAYAAVLPAAPVLPEDEVFASDEQQLDDYDDGGEGTEIRDDPATDTGEIDIDSEAVDVIDEQIED